VTEQIKDWAVPIIAIVPLFIVLVIQFRSIPPEFSLQKRLSYATINTLKLSWRVLSWSLYVLAQVAVAVNGALAPAAGHITHDLPPLPNGGPHDLLSSGGPHDLLSHHDEVAILPEEYGVPARFADPTYGKAPAFDGARELSDRPVPKAPPSINPDPQYAVQTPDAEERLELVAAVKAMQDTLHNMNQWREPLKWNRTQHNLGNRLMELGERDNNTTYMQQAIDAYSRALETCGRKEKPLEWATSVGNQGIARMLLANATGNLVVAKTALLQIATATEVARAFGLAARASYYEKFVAQARAIRDVLQAREDEEVKELAELLLHQQEENRRNANERIQTANAARARQMIPALKKQLNLSRSLP
jgi:hypothetical protein